MTTKCGGQGGKGEAGSALVGVLLVLLMLTALGMVFVALTRTDTEIAGHANRATQAEFQAEAGSGEALARMSLPTTNANYCGQDLNAAAPTPGWGRYIVLANDNSALDPNFAVAAHDSLDNDADGSIDEGDEAYPEIATVQTGNDQVNYPWVNVRYLLDSHRHVMLYGDADNNPATPPILNLTTGMPAIVVSAQGQRGSAEKIIQMTAVRSPVTTPRAAIYAESDDFKFNGTQFLVSGKDWDPATGDTIPGMPLVPGIETTRTPSNITDALHGNQTNNIEGYGAEPAVCNAPYDYDLPGLMDTYAPMADIVMAGGTISNGSAPAWGGYDEYHIVHVTSDLHISGSATGGGILLLEGNLVVSGSFTWYGLIINLGTIDFTGGGAGTHIYGSVMTSGGISQNVVGGQADIKYSSKALARLAGLNPYRPLSWTDLPS